MKLIQFAAGLVVLPLSADAIDANENRTATLLDPLAKDTSEDRRCNLSNFPQWQNEVGYWLGDLSFYGPDGSAFEGAYIGGSWNYPHDHYKGFITGNINGPNMRQRNVFLYPPQHADKCTYTDDTGDGGSDDTCKAERDKCRDTKATKEVTGHGSCGVNGNSKRYQADQSAPPDAPCDGTVRGSVSGYADTESTLVGDSNVILYQAYLMPQHGEGLLQSQLTTFPAPAVRVRSAHGFKPYDGDRETPTYASFYRERRVSRGEFYRALRDALAEYNLLEGDVCTRDGLGALIPGVIGGFDACEAHLEESFAL